MADTKAYTHFNTIPWCSVLLSAPNTRLLIPSSRTPKASTEDSLFAQTLAATTTIPHVLSFFPRPQPSDTEIPVVSTLLAVGDGLNGHPAILHGGIVASILDEAMGVLLNANLERDHVLAVGKGYKDGEVHEGLAMFTKELKVMYRAPVTTPGVMVAKAELLGKSGRGLLTRAVISQWIGDKETVCAIGEAVFVEPRSGRL